ncbi:hypothetical protein KY495_08050 [Massilia sp. PAMC28688]|uniref:hypothetical protein n=1 Tax=Massilia sp. PAMC28688 TaxID=2861283 RepID=UPI001C6344F7|nr:hypothetical protein [Massilia sp. PAMC28688]QYF95093.1 hypothetical protein KY495_08050 [Massilia sp. PAMC28688]
MTAKLEVSLCTPVDLAGPPSAQYVKIDEVMDVCARLGRRLAAECADGLHTRQIVVKALLGLVDEGAPLERIMLYEIANQMPRPDEAPVDSAAPPILDSAAS